MISPLIVKTDVRFRCRVRCYVCCRFAVRIAAHVLRCVELHAVTTRCLRLAPDTLPGWLTLPGLHARLPLTTYRSMRFCLFCRLLRFHFTCLLFILPALLTDAPRFVTLPHCVRDTHSIYVTTSCTLLNVTAAYYYLVWHTATPRCPPGDYHLITYIYLTYRVDAPTVPCPTALRFALPSRSALYALACGSGPRPVAAYTHRLA